MAVVEVPAAPEPGPGEVLVRPEAVGICGSDFHYFMGDIGTFEDPSVLYPRIQGHEASAVIEEIGPDAPGHLRTGERVAIWPVAAAGSASPSSLGRGNTCVNIRLVGIHHDGALQEQLALPAAQVFPTGDLEPALVALIEPVSIAMRTVVRGRVAAGERIVVLGAGPIGQAVALAALDRGATVLLADRVVSRLDAGRAIGAELLAVGDGDDVFQLAREWAGGDGPEVVVEATGVPELVKGAMGLVAPAGRVLVVGLSNADAPIRVGDLPFKEIDVLGVSCCGASEFADAVDLVTRRKDVAAGLVTHQFTLEQAPEAIEYAMRNPTEVMKAVVRVDEGPTS